MEPDYRRFSLNRALFPREPSSSSTRLICGHLNRLKFPPHVETYLFARKEGVNMRKAMARASRCFCRGDHKLTKKAYENDFGFTDSKDLIKKLQEVEIRVKRIRED